MIEVMKKVSEDYGMNVKAARKGKGRKGKGIRVFDVTIDGLMSFLDPSSLWGGIEIKGRKEKALSLKGMWEGLKVFTRKKDIDARFFRDERMVGKDRNCKSYGKMIGIRWGDEILNKSEGIE